MTEASIRALEGLRDFSTIKWYIIPLLAIVFYIYAIEIKKARGSGNWDAVTAGATLFGVDFFNETWNGWVLHFTQRSAFWTAPGDTALRVMVGWNIEIIFMFALSGLIFYHTLSEDRRLKILGLPEEWFWAIGYSAFCVLVEICLNIGDHLVWEYPFWNRSFAGVWLIFFFGYFHFYVAIILVLKIKSQRTRWTVLGVLYGLTGIANFVALGLLGWRY